MNDRHDWAPPPPPLAPSPAINPYAAPQAEITPGTAGAIEGAEQIRRQLLSHEASLRSIGTLYLIGAYLGGFMTLIMLVAVVLIPLFQQQEFQDLGLMIVLLVVYGFFSFVSYYLGRGLRNLDPKVRTGVTIFSVLGLLGFPFGTLINGYILYLLHCEKGKRVMSAEYQRIVAQTPHIKYRTPTWLVILLVLMIAGIAVMIIVGMRA